jgi:hypothetical protein
MQNEKKIVAHGRHVKYLPVSWAYDNIISHPCLLSMLISGLYDTQTPTWLGKKLFEFFVGERVDACISSDPQKLKSNIFDSFLFGKGSNGNLEFQVQRCLCNPFSMLHGGAAAMAAESSVHLLYATNKKKRISQLDLTYLSSIAVGKNACVEFDDGCESGAIHGNITSQGKTAVQFSMLFDNA